MLEQVDVKSIRIEGRIRKDFGDIDSLANSIRENGLIQPIVLILDNDVPKLIAGERRLRALTKLNLSILVHAKHFVWKSELSSYQIKAMELEENLKRQNLNWVEELIAKKQLHDLMVQIHGPASGGRPTHSEQIGVSQGGFGVNKLASLLGESASQSSRDLQLAELILAVPELAKAETKEAARKQAELATHVAVALQMAKAAPPKTEKKWTLYEGDFVAKCNNIEAESIDFIVVDPPYGEDTQGMGPNSKQLLAQGFADSLLPTRDLYSSLAMASWRALRSDRFAAIFFGFALYTDLVASLTSCGFQVDPAPLVWVKNTVINTSPYTRYGRSYEPILLARKGEPKLIRPSQRDVISIENVTTRGTNEQKLYQAQKPVALIEKLILDLCVPGGTVVDWCAGSGTTGEAALKQGRRVVLFERDPIACSIIKGRLGSL